MKGWIKIHRKIQEKGYYKRSKYIHLWLHILLKANHKPTEFMWNNEIIIIKEGQFITGRKQLADETGIRAGTIENILKMLETEHQIEQQKTTKFRLITVINWKEYQVNEQQNGQQSNNKITTNEQQNDTNNNNKNNTINSTDEVCQNEIIYEEIEKPIKKKRTFGNPDINEVISYLKKQIGAELDNTKENNRNMAKHLLNKMKKSYPDKNPVEQIKYLIKYGRKDKFYGGKMTNFGYIYRNSTAISNTIKNNAINKKDQTSDKKLEIQSKIKEISKTCPNCIDGYIHKTEKNNNVEYEKLVPCECIKHLIK